MADQALTCILADIVYDSCENVVTVQGTSTCGATASAPACVGAPTCTLFGTPTPTGTDNLYSFTVEVTQAATYDCDTTATPVTLVGYSTCILAVPTGLTPTQVFACFSFTPIINNVPDCGITLIQSGTTVVLTAQVCVEMKILVASQIQVLSFGPCIIPPGPQATCPVGPFSPPTPPTS